MKYHYHFTPKLIPTLATLILLPILISLGHWQLTRADQNRQLIHNYTTRSAMPPLSEKNLITPPENLNFHLIQLTGEYDNQHTILLDNKIYHDQVGYQVLTPLVLTNHKTVLINRGWIAQGISRQTLPAIANANGRQIIMGTIRTPEKSFTLGPNEIAVSWPLLVQQIDFSDLHKITGKEYYPVIIELNPDQPNGFVRDGSPVFNVTPQRNIAYAFQWFSLALTLIIIFISVNLRRRPE